MAMVEIFMLFARLCISGEQYRYVKAWLIYPAAAWLKRWLIIVYATVAMVRDTNFKI